MVRIRLQRHGSTHTPKYRIVAAEHTVRRDGRFIEILGNYDPQARGKEIPVSINLPRYDYWVSVGAQPSDTVRSLAKKSKKATAAAA
jgi:small subunit ribosomal protein S16